MLERRAAGRHQPLALFRRGPSAWIGDAARLVGHPVPLLGVVTALTILVLAIPHGVYIRAYLQDTVGVLDGVHRMLLGQVPHRDFSTIVGLMLYWLPALFVRLGADPLNGVTYAACALIAGNFFVLRHLLLTRLPGWRGLAFGLWAILALAARLNFGEDPQIVTLAMSYNRNCDVFLCEILIFFIPPAAPTRRTDIVDALILAALLVLVFYSKTTFGLCGLATLGLLGLWGRGTMAVAAAAGMMFLAAGMALEFAFHLHRGLLADTLMAIRSSDPSQRGGLPYECVLNMPEMLACIGLPGAVLLLNRAMTLRRLALFGSVGLMALLLLHYSAQTRILSLPFSLLFIAAAWLTAPTAGADRAGPVSVAKHIPAIDAAIVVVALMYCYPLAVNVAISFVRTLESPPIGDVGPLAELRTDLRDGDAPMAIDWSKEGAPPLDIFEHGANSAASSAPDLLTDPQYVASLRDGIRALREGCGENPRVLTADFSNPFPAILDLPVGGGMLYIHYGLLISDRVHIPAERLFDRIDCVMAPKLPVMIETRDFVLRVYADYLRDHFETVRQTDYWTVMRAIPAGGRPDAARTGG